MLGTHSGDKPSVLVIATGGTVCMQAGYEGALCPTPLAERLSKIPELQDSSSPANLHIIEWTALDSADIGPKEWSLMAQQVEENYADFAGFVILHGTDTLAYSASALSFMLENLDKPVIFTGAMLPISHPHSDAKRNLLRAVFVAATIQCSEVCILFGSRLLRGNRSRKMDCEHLEAFDSPNFPPLALLNSVNFTKPLGVDVVPDSSLFLPRAGRRLKTFCEFCTNVKVETVTPGSFLSSSLKMFGKDHCAERPQGIIIQLYGTGTAPIRDDEFMGAIRRLIELGVCIVSVTQCPRGGCNLQSYTNGIQLKMMGVVDGKEMTLEAAFTKLCFLLGKGYSGNRLKDLMEADLRGEMRNPHIFLHSVANSRAVPDMRGTLLPPSFQTTTNIPIQPTKE